MQSMRWIVTKTDIHVTMPVDDVWKEPKFGKVSCVWNICRVICLFLWGVLSKLILGK